MVIEHLFAFIKPRKWWNWLQEIRKIGFIIKELFLLSSTCQISYLIWSTGVNHQVFPHGPNISYHSTTLSIFNCISYVWPPLMTTSSPPFFNKKSCLQNCDHWLSLLHSPPLAFSINHYDPMKTEITITSLTWGSPPILATKWTQGDCVFTTLTSGLPYNLCDQVKQEESLDHDSNLSLLLTCHDYALVIDLKDLTVWNVSPKYWRLALFVLSWLKPQYVNVMLQPSKNRE